MGLNEVWGCYPNNETMEFKLAVYWGLWGSGKVAPQEVPIVCGGIFEVGPCSWPVYGFPFFRPINYSCLGYIW